MVGRSRSDDLRGKLTSEDSLTCQVTCTVPSVHAWQECFFETRIECMTDVQSAGQIRVHVQHAGSDLRVVAFLYNMQKSR